MDPPPTEKSNDKDKSDGPAKPYPMDWKWDDYFQHTRWIERDIFYRCKTCGTEFGRGNVDDYYKHHRCANLKPAEYPEQAIINLAKDADADTLELISKYKQALADWYARNPTNPQ